MFQNFKTTMVYRGTLNTWLIKHEQQMIKMYKMELIEKVILSDTPSSVSKENYS